ncbi:MAG: Na+/H+ antiporter subunit E [Armatimonadota bacterium]|nr:Na+/H+ antiporter subunit E [Armatimonadota bacterium]MDR7421917.1 Na+/H+ antiporter subunit E [Armatimonadota bacterium]MDR7454450.1 Na+/H+ antiporter subunit E [Armatimonadota bacterium]MDR7457212.1 Na+/H+ antiporter subunit E [Armatimonadota bacterium]MDR7497285.1 Na+/H+ antiporter subunit E [Armatimonadota bacterium]
MLRRVWAGCTALATFVVQNVVATVTVAWLVLHPRRRVRSGIVRVPLDVTTDAAITMLAHGITLIPGTMTVDVAPDRSSLLVHVLDLEDPEATVAEIKRTLEAPIRRMLE